jgi:hypothetical protein
MKLAQRKTAAAPATRQLNPKLLAAVQNGKCILFLGAGVHVPPPPGSPHEKAYPVSVRPPLAKELASRLVKDGNILREHPNEKCNAANLSRMARFYEMMYERNELVKEIINAVGPEREPSAALRALAQLDFPLVMTTNYDQLFEAALQKAGKKPRKGVYDREAAKPTTDFPDDDLLTNFDRPFLFKVHGDIDVPSSMVITDEDYIQFLLRMGDRDPYQPIPETFRVQFKRWPTLFIGYRLIDFNLRLLFKSLRWKLDPADRKAAYSVDLYPDPPVVAELQDKEGHVFFIVDNLWNFVPQLYRSVRRKPMPV